jgi:hypothetical protein
MKYPHPDEFCLKYLLNHRQLLRGQCSGFMTALLFTTYEVWPGVCYPLWRLAHKRSLPVESGIFSRVCDVRDPEVRFFFLLSMPAKLIAPPIYARLFRKTMPYFLRRKRYLLALTGSLLGFCRWNPRAARRMKPEIEFLLAQRHPNIPYAALCPAIRAGYVCSRSISVLVRAIGHPTWSYRALAAEALECACELEPMKRRQFVALLTPRQQEVLRAMLKRPKRFGRARESLEETLRELLG